MSKEYRLWHVNGDLVAWVEITENEDGTWTVEKFHEVRESQTVTAASEGFADWEAEEYLEKCKREAMEAARNEYGPGDYSGDYSIQEVVD